MTEAEHHQILTTFKESIVADPKLEFGPITENPSSDQPGIWIQAAGHQAYLGASYEAALLTAQLSDWWIPSRDGDLTVDDIEWFETRAKLGENWEKREIPMFKEERRTRLALNIGFTFDGELRG